MSARGVAVVVLGVVGGLGLMGPRLVSAGEKASPAIQQHVQTVIAKWGEDPIVVAAVRAQNASHRSLKEIQQLDAKWQSTPGMSDFMRGLVDSDCGQRLKQLEAETGFYAEIFVTDNQGANVCMSDKTSDYWQGDEDKFIKAFAGGQGAVFIDDVKFDESSQVYTVQASLPVVDGGRAIGTMTVGIDVDAFERR